MAPTPSTHFITNNNNNGEEQQEEAIVEIAELEKLSQECRDLVLSLPRERGWRTRYLYLFQGFWCQPAEIQAITFLQNQFQSKDSDIIVATIPKSGTTWLKALTFAIVNREKFSPFSTNHPLLHSNPHHLVPFFEYTVYNHHDNYQLSQEAPDPRFYGTHIPFEAMPGSIKASGCKIIYICRNPFDTFVSSWIFVNKIKPKSLPPITLEEAFDMYCKGIIGFGPSWDHMLRYWNESKERPNKVLFLKFEDLKEDTRNHVKRIAEFLGCPFSFEDDDEIINGIIKLCSFEKMKDLEVNKNGTFARDFESKHLFRKAEIGDFVNHLSPSMVERLSKVIDEKFAGSGLSFKVS